MKKSLFAILLAFVFVLTACGNGNQASTEAETSAAEETTTAASENADAPETSAEANAEGAALSEPVTLKIGVSPVPHGEIVEAAKENLAKRGVNVEIVTYDDYVVPNQALASGDIDVNYFQHEPYFEDFKKQNNLDLKKLGTVHIEPMAIFSATVKDLNDVPEGGKVLIPNDPTNGARALLLLEKQGLIKLDDPTNISATEANITENPKNLTFVPLEAAIVGRTYQDGDLAVINSNYALEAGLNPVTDSLAIEDKDSPYANILAVRTGEENEEKFKILLEELNSDTVKKFIEDKYQGAVIPAFSNAQ
ncbi:MAG: MetQ/NlpA family ABC transporter substrate-binding protein [Peptoniphilaceae bacterium]|nr:MetQ/NlpA family ABC transporter substrate-binding protein [Peptoniphilaceae bacterium]MDY6085892.1 MetQ/NlpA family ABC transporter substrate-binding protein [Peptoniphilaceae bacterium]